jgi:hypothetical protein
VIHYPRDCMCRRHHGLLRSPLCPHASVLGSKCRVAPCNGLGRLAERLCGPVDVLEHP